MEDKNTVYMSEKQKVKEITDKLEAGLKELFESEKYKSYLSTMSKFHNYSFNNTLLIAMQKPEATLVAGYQAWQKNFERHVNKGEKAIRILAPAPYKIKEERDKLDPVTGEMMFDENGMPQKEETEVTIPAFRAVSVFDVSQTDGKPIPELEVNELLSTVEGYEDFVQALMNISPVPIAFEDIPGDSKGYFSTAEKRIAVQENMSESQTLKTMVHEVAHSRLHDKEVNQSMDIPVKDRNRGLGSIDIMAAVRSLIFIGKVRKDPTTRVLIHEKSSLAPPGETMAFKLGDEEGFRWVGAYEISADELLDGKEGKATETKLERGAKLIRELLADKKEISIRELDEKAKEQGISGRTMRDVRSRMKNELEYQVNEKQENSIRLKE